MIRFVRLALGVVCLSHVFINASSGQDGPSVSVSDAIAMTRLGDSRYFQGAAVSDIPVAHFSPDKSRFVVILRSAELADNANEYTMLVFKSDQIFETSKPAATFRMKS